MDNENSMLDNKVVNNFYCEKCNYRTSRKFNYDKHISTSKHLDTSVKIVNLAETLKDNVYHCKCGKKYKYIQGIYKHKKYYCNENKKNENDVKPENIKTQNENILINNLITPFNISNADLYNFC